MGIQRIEMYNIGFYICLFLAIMGALLSVILFFTLRIREAWRMNSGKAKSESIRKMRLNVGAGKVGADTFPPEAQEVRRIQTGVLKRPETVGPFSTNASGTVVLAKPIGERPTELLNPSASKEHLGSAGEKNMEDPRFVLTKNIMVIHTNEKIRGGI